MSENKCPDCNLNLDHHDWIVFEAHDLMCHHCNTIYSLLAMAKYLEEQTVGETTAHNFQLSYPYTCVCGFKHKVVSILCHPIEVTKQFESMKKEIPNDPIQGNSE